ncbi:MAG: peptidoglycan editing factor PgeF [Acidobacteriota bacterium]|nr:peptidoglycan editing factor PgeF [Acidobacteriota bacterium]
MPHFFTDRRGGSSLGAYESLNFGFHVGDDPVAVSANRSTIPNVQFMNQVHGDNVVVIDKKLETDPTCDAMITTKPGISLAVMVADCIPLLFVSKEAVAAVHVGRAGLINRVAIKALHQMRTMGAIDVHAIIGPSICGRCYEVPFEMQQDVIADHPRAFATTHTGTPGLDLPAGLIAELVAEGVTYEASTVCTMEDELFFSHRKHNPTGRFAGVVSL